MDFLDFASSPRHPMNLDIRVSLVDYVNALPLTWGFLRGAVDGVECLSDVPSACAERLLRGEVDAGLVPSIEAARIPGIRIVRGVGIASRRHVRSVLLASRRPLEEAKTVALDQASRSSAVMAQILYDDLLKTQPTFHVGPSDLDEMLSHHDAGLLIGDPALNADLRGLYVLDLAEAWHRLTGLPFVFAVWAVRPEIAPEPFLWSRDYAKTRRVEVLEFAEKRTGLTRGVLAEYLEGNLHHDLEEQDEKGLAEFFRRAAAHGFISSADLPPFAGVPLVPRRGA